MFKFHSYLRCVCFCIIYLIWLPSNSLYQIDGVCVLIHSVQLIFEMASHLLIPFNHLHVVVVIVIIMVVQLLRSSNFRQAITM